MWAYSFFSYGRGLRLRFGLVACCVLSQLRLYWNCSHKICREGETMDNDAINSLTKKWTANLVYLFLFW